jgi:hypothetical protein
VSSMSDVVRATLGIDERDCPNCRYYGGEIFPGSGRLCVLLETKKRNWGDCVDGENGPSKWEPNLPEE